MAGLVFESVEWKRASELSFWGLVADWARHSCVSTRAILQWSDSITPNSISAYRTVARDFGGLGF